MIIRRLVLPVFPLLVSAVFSFFSGSAFSQDKPTTSTSPVASDSSTSPALELLRRIETKHGGFMTMIVRFTQVRVEKEFGDEIRSQGTLFLAMPDLLRCEYEKPDPSVILFSGASFYQYVPSIAQVDKFTYSTVEEARERLRMLLLGFGVSGLEVEKSYAVSLIPAETPAPESVSGKSAGLAFVPLRDEIARDYSRILVWFSEKTLLPRHVRLIQVSGDETDVQIRDIRRDAPVADSLFKPEFPRGVEIIEHTAAQAPAPIRETIQMEDLK